ncbi:MAG: DUF3662 domain-containing protein [Firmicutes bacterium]|nr:DUF3662 domain-containing protein [Bacillota bacterium]
MLSDRRVSTVHVYVPNRFVVYINPGDWKKLEPLHLTITQEMSQYLDERAEKSGVSFAAPVKIDFRPVEDISPGSVRIEAYFQESEDQESVVNGAVGETGSLGKDGEKEKGDGTQVYRLPSGPNSVNPRAELVALGGPQKGQVWTLGEEDVSIGRGPGQYVRLTDPSVSRSHAVVRLRQGRYWIEDNNSTNGVKLTAKQVKNAILSDGDLIELGTTRLRFRMVK